MDGPSIDRTFERRPEDEPVLAACREAWSEPVGRFLSGRWWDGVRRAEALSSSPGDRLGRFELRERIGEGGMGVVWRAWDPQLGREIALKVLARVSSRPEVVRRFLSEVTIHARLEHPSIAPLYESGVDPAGGVYFAMQLVRGRDLAHRLADEAYPLVRRLADFLKAMDGVAYAHSKGVLHRDLKPSNVLLGEFGEVLVADWGLAKLRELGAEEPGPAGEEDLSPARTREGTRLGTPAYMPPEQAEGRLADVDQRSDVYSLGATLYEVLTRTPPFGDLSGEDLLTRVAQGRLAPPSWKDPRLPRELDAIVLRAMARRKEDRYPDVGRMREDLAAFLDGRPLADLAYSWTERTAKWVRRHRAPAAIAAIAAVSLAVAGALDYWRVDRERAVAVEARGEAERLLEASRRREEALRSLERGRLALEEAGVPPSRVRVDAARGAIERGIALDSGLALGPYLLGRAHELLGELDAARAAWRRAAAIDPDFAPARFRLGRLLLALAGERLLAAIEEDASPAWTIGPDLAEARLELEAAVASADSAEGQLADTVARAFLALARGDREGAARTAEEGSRRFAGAPGVEDLAWVAGMATEGEERLAAFTRAIEARPDHVLALISRALALLAARRPQDALRDADRAVELRPGSATLRLYRARCRLRLDRREDWQAALEDCERAVERAPDWADAWAERGRARNQLGDPAGAIDDYEGALRIDPTLVKARVRRGEALIELGRIAEAVSELDHAIELDPASPKALLLRGRSRKALGDAAGARSDLEACRRLVRPDSPLDRQARKALDGLPPD